MQSLFILFLSLTGSAHLALSALLFFLAYFLLEPEIIQKKRFFFHYGHFKKRLILSIFIIFLAFLTLAYVVFKLTEISEKDKEKQQNQSQVSVNNQQQNVSAENQSTAIGNNTNYGEQNFYQINGKNEPAISMNVEVLSDNPFDADFLISNGGQMDAENVTVKILFFDYFGGPDNKCKTYLILGRLNEKDKIIRNLGLIKAGATRVNAKIRDLISYDTTPMLGFSGCGTKTIMELSVLNDEMVNIIALPPELKSHFKSSLVCFDIDYEWQDKNLTKKDTERFGFTYDKEKFGNTWLVRSNICTSKYIQSRLDSLAKVVERDRFL